MGNFLIQKMSGTVMLLNGTVRRIQEYTSDLERSFKIVRDGVTSGVKVRKVYRRLEYLVSLRRRTLGTPEVDSLARGVVYGGRDTYEYKKERRVNNEVVEEVCRIMDKRIYREERELRSVMREERKKCWRVSNLFKNNEECKEGLSIEDIEWFYWKVWEWEVGRIDEVVWEEYKKKWEERVGQRKEENRVRKDPRLEGFDVLDREVKKREEKVGEVINFIVLDGIELSENEQKYLNLPLKFRERVVEWLEEVEGDVECSAVKQRWEAEFINRMEEEGVEGKKEEKEYRDKEDKERKESRDIVNKDSNLIELCKLDVNTLAKNPRSFEPRMEISGQEVRIQAQKLDILGKAREVKGSTKRNSNLTKEDDIGKRSLLDRVRKGEIVIATTDKSGKLVVSKPETYLEALAVHTTKVEEIDRD